MGNSGQKMCLNRPSGPITNISQAGTREALTLTPDTESLQ